MTEAVQVALITSSGPTLIGVLVWWQGRKTHTAVNGASAALRQEIADLKAAALAAKGPHQ